MLEHEITLEYIGKAQNGDESAKEILIRENLPLIKSLVKRYLGRGIDYDDLMQLGSMGLIKAILNFNTVFSVRFSTYAVPMISGEIKRFLRDEGAIKVSRSIKMLNMQISKFMENYRNEKNEEPTVAILAQEFKTSEEDIVFALDSSHIPISLFDGEDSENNLSVIDKIKVEDGAEDVLDKMLLAEVIDTLPEKEKQVILLRFYRDKTQSEIAQILGVSQVQISRIESKVIEKLRKKLIS